MSTAVQKMDTDSSKNEDELKKIQQNNGAVATNNANGAAAKKDKKKKKKKDKKKKKKKKNNKDATNDEENGDENKENDKVEIEYVTVNPLEDVADNPAFAEFQAIIEKFTKTEDGEEAVAKLVTEAQAAKVEQDGELEDDKPKISKKQKKREKRISIAILKTLVKKPETVETWDATAADPALLVHLKSYRNTVPVPRHWNQKRKYLQGKRGIEKPPFQLPEFIAATGISKIRQAIQDKDNSKKEKTKARERMQPKLGKIDIDYQVLHDAFFKYQTKPKLTIHGDLYYEGKEFEITLREKRPGGLTEDLKRALGMPDGAPPPWLINMQRYGPPPSYPNLKIPGLNAPIPEGARYGYHAGGWGKPPVDEFGRPLYGDVFGTAPSEPPPEISEPIVRQHWGELEQEEEEEVVEEEQAEQPEEEAPASGFETPSGLATPSSGMETPETIELRKTSAKKEAHAEEDESGRQLYQVIPQANTAVGTALVGSSHKYIIPSEKKEPKAKNAVDMVFMKSQRGEKVDIALNPAEVENLEDLSVDILKKKYDAAINEKLAPKEDVSDIIAEHSKKRKKEGKDKDKGSKKYKDFKF